MSYRFIDKSPNMRFVIWGLLAIACVADATYNGRVVTRQYAVEHREEEPTLTTYTETILHKIPVNITKEEHHYSYGSGSNGDGSSNDYQQTVTHQTHGGASQGTWSQTSYGQSGVSGNSYQQQQREGDYYQQHNQNNQGYRQHHQHGQQQPQYTANYVATYGSSQQQGGGNWQHTENSISDYYTGCPAGHTGQLPYAYDCRRFLNCWKGRGHIQSCSVGTVFNPETLECDRPDKVKCGANLALGSSHGQLQQNTHSSYKSGRLTDVSTSEVDILCPPGAEGPQPHPSDCLKFINCANGNVHIQDCGPGTAFSVTMKNCDFIDKVDCSDRGGSGVAGGSGVRQESHHTTSHSTTGGGGFNDSPHNADILCLSGITGIFPYPFDYTKFINCKNGNTAIQNCVHGTAFSISKGYCEPLEQIVKTDHVMYIVSEVSYEYSQTLITCPPGTEGVHLYPFNGEKFVKCIHSQMEVKSCPSAQVFSTTRRLCLPLNQVLRNERVRLLSELQKSNAYRFTDEFFDVHTMVYCPLGLSGTYPHPFDSSKYINCGGGRMLSESCASGKAYSLSRKECGLKEEIDANDRVAQTQVNHNGDWHISDIETTFGSIDGLTYLMCPPGLSGFFLHPFDCTKYLLCENGVTKVNSCDNGSVYSISRKKCIPRDRVEAFDRVEYMVTTQHELSNEFAVNSETDLGVNCRPGTFGVYPHPENYRMYVRCSNGRITVEYCLPGQAFSIHRGLCYNEKEVALNDRSAYTKSYDSGQSGYVSGTGTGVGIQGSTQTQTHYASGGVGHAATTSTTTHSSGTNGYNTEAFTPEHKELTCPGPNSNGRYPHPYDCTKFIMCSNGDAHIQSCGPGTAWNREMEVCDFKDKVDCSHIGSYTTQTTATQNEILCPPGYEGLYEHPYDWHKYLSCTNGRTYIMDCGVGTVFSVARKTCDIETKVDNSDRCNKGVRHHNYDYSYRQNTNAQPNVYGTSYNQWSYNKTQQQQQPTGSSFDEILCPPGYEGLYEHPYDWHKYLSCTNGRTYIMDCGVGTVFSVARKTCDIETKVDNSDRCNKGVRHHNYDYSYRQTTNAQPNTYGTSYNQWSYNKTQQQQQPAGSTTTTTTTYTQTQPTYNDRWTSMNVPHPQAPNYNQHTTVTHQQQPSSTWSVTTVNGDSQRPLATGDWRHDSNYNINHNTPLAPLAPLAPPNSGTSTSTSTIVYAQPVGSQEDSQEVFNTHHYIQPNPSIHPNPSTTNRQNFTRNINYTPISNIWIPTGPNTQYLPAPAQGPAVVPMYIDTRPPYPGNIPNTPLYYNNRVQGRVHPPGSPMSPPLYTPQYPSGSHVPLPTNQAQGPFHPPGSPLTPSGTVPQYPSGSHVPLVPLPPNHMLPPLYSKTDEGQRPITDTGDLTWNGQTGTFVINVEDNQPSESRKVHSVDISQRNPSPNPIPTTTTQRNVVRVYEYTTQIPQPSEATTPLHIIPNYPILSNATIQTFPQQPHYSHGYSEVTHSRNSTVIGRKVPQHSAIKPINQGPTTRLEKSKRTNEEEEYEEKSNLDLNDPQNLPLKEALQLMLRPYLNHSGPVNEELASKAESHIMSLVTTSNTTPSTPANTTSTTSYNPLNSTLVPSNSTTKLGHHQDVELIFAGEQNHLGHHETTSLHTYGAGGGGSYGTTLESERSTSTKTIHNHNPNWHKHHQHNPSSSKVHSREFHEKNPNLPNPFGEDENVYSIDIRSDNYCPFNCGNGRCIQSHEVCNGVNNCGNRKDEMECDHLGYEVRLTGGESSNMGRVEVKILGKWGYVCDDKFGLKDADVLCRELGFKMGAMEVRGSSYYPPSDINTSFNMDEVECKGNETSLRECDFKGWGVNNCGPDEIVGVVCKIQKMKCPDNYWLCAKSEECIPTAFVCDLTPDCSDGSDESSQVCNAPIQYRLEGGRSKNEGRLEVLYRGEWGTVCDDDFGVKEAQVVCNALGFYGKPEVIKNIYGPGRGPIWLDQVSCLGNETCLDKCNHFTWGENNCQHTEDVGLKCTAGPKLAPSYVPSYTDNDKDLKQQEVDYEQTESDDLGIYLGLWQRSSKAINQQKQCGHFKTNLTDEYAHPEERVINGSIAKRGRHPWQATIRTRGRGGISSHWCGAVIISKKLVLTAAHCLAGYPKGSYFVRMGDHYANIAEASEIDLNIENWYIHEKFRDQKHMNNDIALILLKNPVRFNDYIQPICLPPKGAQLEANRKCTISGWGSIKSGTSTPSNILRAAEVPILSEDVCSRKDVYANAMSEGMFCAGYLDENADACDGDSGGPLVCHDDDGETLYGIISWGQHCGYRNHPGVYVRVEKYIDWIYEKINLMIQQKKL